MMTFAILSIAALAAFSPAAAQPPIVDCPLPPYQASVDPLAGGFFDETGAYYILGEDAPLALPDGLSVTQAVWSDDGAVALLLVSDDALDQRVFKYADGAATEILNQDALLAMRDETFRDAVQLFNPAFIPGTHTVLANTEVLSSADGIYFEIPLDVWSLDLDSGALANLLPYGEGGRFYIAPDGESLVLMDFTHLWQTGIDGQTPRTIDTFSVALGLGEEVGYPPLVWDTSGEALAFRTLVFPTYDPNTGGVNVPFELRQYTLGEEIAVEMLLTGPAAFFPSVRLSPDGWRVAQWAWQDSAAPTAFDVNVYAPDTATLTLASVELPEGATPFVRWDGSTHISYGFSDPDSGETAWRVDLCGEIVDLADVP